MTSLIELQSFDMHTSPTHLLTALQPFWSTVYRWGAKSAKLILTTDYIDAESAQAGFETLAVPFEELPLEVGYYRTQYERHLRETVQTTKFIRAYLLIDCTQTTATIARIIEATGIQVREVEPETVPLPFRRGERDGRIIIDPDGQRWAGIQTQMKQDFAHIYTELLHRLYALDFPLWVVIEVKNYSPTETIQLFKTKQATITVTQGHREKQNSRAEQTKAAEMQTAIDRLNTEVRTVGNALHELSIALIIGGDSLEQLRERREILAGTCPLALNTHWMQARNIPKLFTPNLVMARGFLVSSIGLAHLSGSALSWLAPTNTEGNILGYTQTNAPVIFDPFAETYNSYNSVVLGQTGSGKTFFVLLSMLRSLLLGTRLVMVDMKGEVDLSWLGDEVYEKVKFGTEKTPINLLRVAFDEIGGQIAFIAGIMNRLRVVKADEDEEAVFKKALFWLYARQFGKEIVAAEKDEVLAILEGREDRTAEAQRTQRREQTTEARRTRRGGEIETGDRVKPPSFPVLQTLVGVIAQDEHVPVAVREAAERIAFRLDAFVADAEAEMFGQLDGTTLTFKKPVTVIDISSFPKRETNPSLRAALLAVTFGMIDKAVELRRDAGQYEPIRIFFDEIGDALADEITGAYVESKYRLARSQLVGWIVADQTGSSLQGSPYGRQMLANSASTYIFYQEGTEKETLKSLFPDLPDAYRESIHTLPKGTCVAKLPEGVYQLAVVPSMLELLLLSSQLQHREARQRQIAQMKAEISRYAE